MTIPQTIDELAAALLQARASGLPLSVDAAVPPASEAEAYAAQTATIGALVPRHGPVAGWKTGRAHPGGPMLYSPILSALVRGSPARFTAGESRLRGVELEFGFRLDAHPPPPGAPDFAERLRRGVSLVPVIEVVDSRLAEAGAAPLLLQLADLQLNAGLAIGAPLSDWSGLRLDRVTVRWEIDGRVVADGEAATPGGDAFATLCAFAEAVGAHCGGLRKGHVVTTGSLTGLVWAPPGARVRGEIAGLGAVEVAFAG